MTEPSTSRQLLRGFAIAAFGAILVYLFFGEHRVHLLGYLPFLFLLACPLMHLTMHHGHGGHGSHHDRSPGPQAAGSPQQRTDGTPNA